VKNRSASAQALRLKDLNKQENRKEVVKTNNKTGKSSSKKEIRVNPRNLRLKKETGVKRCQMVLTKKNTGDKTVHFGEIW